MNPKQCKNPKHECEYCQLRYSANNALGISVKHIAVSAFILALIALCLNLLKM